MEGYVLCVECDETWVRSEVAQRTSGRCPKCYAVDGSRLAEIELVGRGMKVRVPVRGRRQTPRRRTEAGRERRRQARAAKDAARKRLAAIFPDLFDVLVADERAARGLEPWPVEVAARGGSPDVDVAFAELSLELSGRGVG